MVEDSDDRAFGVSPPVLKCNGVLPEVAPSRSFVQGRNAQSPAVRCASAGHTTGHTQHRVTLLASRR